jgi:hypothetical protein
LPNRLLWSKLRGYRCDCDEAFQSNGVRVTRPAQSASFSSLPSIAEAAQAICKIRYPPPTNDRKFVALSGRLIR